MSEYERKSESHRSGRNERVDETKHVDSGGKPQDDDVKAKGSISAVVVGIDDYSGDLNDLPSCVNDAHAFERLLRDRYGAQNVEVLLDREATVANVTTRLQSLTEGATKDDRVVFYYSGHGSTVTKGSVTEECLVLYDDFLLDDLFVRLSQQLPPGVFTVVLDCCFSGGLEKRLLAAQSVDGGEVNVARVKAFTRTDGTAFYKHSADVKNARVLKRFGSAATEFDHFIGPPPFVPPDFWLNVLSKRATNAPATDEPQQLQLNGLLMAACLETETASASTATTKGLSAFTYSLLSVLEGAKTELTADAVTEAVQTNLKRLGFRQTPVRKEPIRPPRMAAKTFITVREPKATEPNSNLLPTPHFNHELSQGGTLMNSTMETLLAAALPQLLNRTPDNGSGASGRFWSSEVITTLVRAALESMRPKANEEKQQKIFGIDDAILIPAIATVVTAAIQKNGRGPAQPTTDKLFGIDDAILIPAIASVVTAAVTKGNGAHGKSGFSGASQKLFGIDDAILIPALVSIATAAVSKTNGARPKLFGIDDAILIPAIASVVTAAISKRADPNSKLFGIDDAVLLPVLASAVSAAIRN